jgi:large subunit ribosomal protein L30
LVKSPHGRNQPQRRTLEALGLRKINQTVERPDHPSVQGMINRVKHLVVVE